MYYLGIDIGSLSCDAVIINKDGKAVAWAVVPTGAKNRSAIERARAEVLNIAGIDQKEIEAIVSTGYGRDRVEKKDATVTEITCHARGVSALIPETRVLVDIGGQDSKAIRLGPEGKVMDFAMNDKCAAGTGRFLEAMARALQVDIDELGNLDQGATKDLTLSSMCTVFAESEVVSLIAQGMETNEIVRGLCRSIASRTVSLVKRVGGDAPDLAVSMSGGVAHNKGVIRAISEALGKEVKAPEKPDTVGALGAALIARDKAAKE